MTDTNEIKRRMRDEHRAAARLLATSLIAAQGQYAAVEVGPALVVVAREGAREALAELIWSMGGEPQKLTLTAEEDDGA